jgi:hypothetical protein
MTRVAPIPGEEIIDHVHLRVRGGSGTMISSTFKTLDE